MISHMQNIMFFQKKTQCAIKIAFECPCICSGCIKGNNKSIKSISHGRYSFIDGFALYSKRLQRKYHFLHRNDKGISAKLAEIDALKGSHSELQLIRHFVRKGDIVPPLFSSSCMSRTTDYIFRCIVNDRSRTLQFLKPFSTLGFECQITGGLNLTFGRFECRGDLMANRNQCNKDCNNRTNSLNPCSPIRRTQRSPARETYPLQQHPACLDQSANKKKHPTKSLNDFHLVSNLYLKGILA